MNSLPRRRVAGFSLVELLVVIAIIGILAALLLPALTRSKQRAIRIECIGNLKEQGTAFHLFAHDHNGHFPMQTPASDGGSLDYAQSGMHLDQFYFSYRHFQPLSHELVLPRLVVCPADVERAPAESFDLLQNSNLSYFVNVTAEYGRSDSVLAGDRNITNNFSSSATVVRGTYGLRWTRDLHFYKGNVLFSDGHVEELNDLRLDLPAEQAANTYLVVPSTPPASSGGPRTLPASSTPPESSGNPQASSPSGEKPAADNPSAPPPKTPPLPPPPARGGASGSSSMRVTAAGPELLAEATPPERVVSNPPPPRITPKAPPAEDPEEETPLQWILKNLRALVARMSWWMLLLILILMAVTLYFYIRRKISERARTPARRR